MSVFELVYLIFCGLVLIYVAAKLIIMLQNRRKNRLCIEKLPIMVNDQNLEKSSVQSLQYGRKSMTHNGCEIIAVYNAMQLIGMPKSIAKIAADFQIIGGMIGFGFLGSNPLAVGRVLHRNKIKYKSVGQAGINSDGVYILSYWNKGAPFNGLHTVAFKREGESLKTYNLAGNNTVFCGEPSLFFGKRLICAYKVEPKKA